MTNNRVERTDPAFYVACDGPEYVFQEWDENDAPYSVVRNGEMRINIRESENDNWETIRSTKDLFDWNIDTDNDLLNWELRGEKFFEWIDNPWFEIVDENQEAQSWAELALNIYDDLDTAEKACMLMNEQYRKENA